MTLTHAVRFPGETAAFRQARNRLLQAELELQRQVLAVAELRRQLPLGGEVQDYAFEEGGTALEDTATVRSVRLSELFAPGQHTLVLYSTMFGPDMQQPCPMCTSFLDGLDGSAPHIRQRVSLAVVAKSPLARIRAFAHSRAGGTGGTCACSPPRTTPTTATGTARTPAGTSSPC